MAWKIMRRGYGPGEHSLGPELLMFDAEGVGWTTTREVALTALAFPGLFTVVEVLEALPTARQGGTVPLAAAVPAEEDTVALEITTVSPEAVQEVLALTAFPPPGEWTQARLEEETVATLQAVADVLGLSLPKATRKADLIQALLVAQEDVILPDPPASQPPRVVPAPATPME